MGSRSAVLAAALLVAAVAGTGSALGATAATRPAIVSLTAATRGTSVVLTARVRAATTCTFSGAGVTRRVACKAGKASATLPGPATRSVTYTLVANGPGGTARRTVAVAAAAPRATLSLTSTALGYSGDVVTVTYSSSNATRCTLQADPALWSGANPAPVDCNGHYDANIGTTLAARSWTFTFTATNAAGRSATATATLTQEAPLAPAASLTAGAASVHSVGGTVHLTYSSSNAVTCTLTSSPSLWSGSGCNGSSDVTIPPTGLGRRITFTFTAANGAGQTASSTQTVVQPGSSSNWSGYVVFSSSVITSASATWTVPRLDCSRTPNGGASEWVGTGGAGNSGILLQTGVATDCVGGVQVNYAWWELLPDYAHTFGGLTISVGDTIQASVYRWSDGSRWETRVDDLTTGLSGVMVTGEGYGILRDGSSSFPISGPANVSYAGGTSAEWIVEAYELNGSQVSLAAYGTVTFTDVSASMPLSLTLADAIELVDGDAVISTPAAPSGSSFSVAYSG